jgi:hypothetical protein
MSSVTIHTAATLALEWGISNLIADPAQVDKYDPNNPKQLNIKENPSGYDPFGRYPGAETDPTKTRLGFKDNEIWTLSQKGEPIALVGKAPKIGGLSRIFPGEGVPHTGASILSINGGNTIKQIAPTWTYGSLFGTCHQATNATLLRGGISSTVAGIFSDWEMKATTIIYGNYGGALPQKFYQGIKAYNDD